LNPENSKPIFQPHQSVSTEEALKITYLVAQWFENNTLLDYFKIPHALSSLWWNAGQEIGVQMERSFDERDPYIEEESMLAPAESRTDRFWRRSVSRLTYLISQLFFALLTGELPRYPNQLAPSKLISKHTPQEIELLQKFFAMALDRLPENRYQSFTDIRESLEWLKCQLFPAVAAPSSQSTSKRLPKIPQAFYRKVVTTQIQAVSAPKKSSLKYEIQIWNPSYKNAAKLSVETPSLVTIGRKPASEDQKSSGKSESKETIKMPQFHRGDVLDTIEIGQEVEEKDGVIYYRIAVEGDNCLSRKHIEVRLPGDDLEKPSLKDLGSTHGVVLFRDRTRNISNSFHILPGTESSFLCQEDQYLKLGNTYIRIRPAPPLGESQDEDTV
jgi:hypothetical protein